MNKVTWKTASVPTVKLAQWLNEREFKPGNFYLLADPSTAFQTVVIYAEEETDGDQ